VEIWIWRVLDVVGRSVMGLGDEQFEGKELEASCEQVHGSCRWQQTARPSTYLGT
jgi:hypothetical protein